METQESTVGNDAAVRRAGIETVDAQIVPLEVERDAFPILQLPVELVSKIFVQHLPDDPFDRTYIPATILGSVCRDWRDLTLCTPQLWSSWSFSIDECFTAEVRENIGLWLSRSQNYPLSVRLCTPDMSNRVWRRVLLQSSTDVLEKLIEHRHHWKHLELNLPLQAMWALADIHDRKDLPYLTHLTLGSVEDDVVLSDPGEAITLFGVTPQLRSLHLLIESRQFFARMDHIEIPFVQLTSFIGTSFTPTECLSVLVKMPALVNCAFYLKDGLFVGQPVVLPHLRSLKLWPSEPEADPTKLLAEHLTAPSLETLVVKPKGSIRVARSLGRFVERSKCTIRHFTCEGLRHEYFIQCLVLLPALETLELLNYEQQHAIGVFHRLSSELVRANNNEAASWLPRLQSISVQCKSLVQDVESPFPALMVLLYGLADRTPPLRHFKFRLVCSTNTSAPCQPTPAEAERMEKIREKGMIIEIEP